MAITTRSQASVVNEVGKGLRSEFPGTKASVAEVSAAGVRQELTGELSAGAGIGHQAGNYKPHPVTKNDPRLSAADQQVQQTPSVNDPRQDQSVDANAPEKQLQPSPAAQQQLGLDNAPSAAPELKRG